MAKELLDLSEYRKRVSSLSRIYSQYKMEVQNDSASDMEVHNFFPASQACLNTLTEESGCENASMRAKHGKAGISFI